MKWNEMKCLAITAQSPMLYCFRLTTRKHVLVDLSYHIFGCLGDKNCIVHIAGLADIFMVFVPYRAEKNLEWINAGLT